MGRKPGKLILVLIIVGYAIYAGIFIQKTSFVVGGERYYVLFDDAMISMRYAKNLAAGSGPVWNPGDQVEGYTNPLWVGYMALWHLLPIPASKISLFIQASGALTIIISLIFLNKIGEQLTKNWLVPLLGVLLTAFYLPLNTWALEGMEVGALVMILAIAVGGATKTLQSGEFSPWPFIWLGIGTLVRMDMAVPFLATAGILWLLDPANRRSHLIWAVGVLVVFLGGQTLFRVAYYGELLPNTYYLKMSGVPTLLRVQRGAFVLFKFVWNFNWLLFIIPFSLLLFRRDKAVLLLFAVLLGQVAYSVYVGGDAWEHKGGANRFLSLGMPFFFMLFVLAADEIRRRLVDAQDQQPNPARARFATLGLVAFVLVSMLNFNSLLDTRSLSKWLLRSDPLFIQANKDYVPMALAVQAITTREASVAVVSAGAIPYFADRYSLDLLGKGDARIAREPMHLAKNLPLIDLRPGHMKWDYPYSIGELRPDVIVQLWQGAEVVRQVLDQDYTLIQAGGYPMYVRNGSSNVIWEGLEAANQQPGTVEP